MITFVSALPHMTDALIKAVITADMAGHEPLHPPAQVVSPFRGNQKVKMVGHEAPGEHLDGISITGFGHQFSKGMIVAFSVEYLLASVTPVYNMINQAVGQTPCYSRHVVLLINGCVS
jgi:hypothetical protein